MDSSQISSLQSVFTHPPKSLKDALLMQFHHNPQGVDLSLGDFIIDCIDPSGYIYIFESVVAGAMNTTITKVREAIAVIQSLCPAGVCARNKIECYTLQLKAIQPTNQVALEIVQHHLPLLKVDRYEELAQLTGSTLEQVIEARDIIRTLVLEPGITFMQLIKQSSAS